MTGPVRTPPAQPAPRVRSPRPAARGATYAPTLPANVYRLLHSRPIDTNRRVLKDLVSGAIDTSLMYNHADLFVKPAVYTCAGCQGHVCGGHFLRASFSGPGLTAPVTFDACHACLMQMIRH
jgi:hypothetical protein